MTEYFPAKTGEYPRIFPIFQNCARCEKDLKNNKHNDINLRRKYARIFVPRSSHFRERSSRKTVSFEEEIMSKDKYPSIFSRQMETIVYIFPNFENCACCEIYFKDNKQNSFHVARKMCSDICPWTLSVPQSS